MKRNAILRICVYGGLILLLAAILAVGIFGMSTGAREKYVMATVAPMSEAAVPVTAPVEMREVLATGTTRAALNVYSSPSVDASVCGTMSKDTPVEVQIIERVSGEEWAYVWGVAPGWVQLPLLELDEEFQAPQETVQTVVEDSRVLTSGIGTATVTADMLNVRSVPSSEAECVGKLKKGDRVTVLEIQNAMDISWAFVRWDDHAAWAMMDYLEMDADAVPETSVTLLEEGEPGVRKFHRNITGLNITWPSGKVTVETGDVEVPEVRAEDGTAQCMVTEKGRLKIEAVSRLLDFKKKDVTVVFPENYEIEKLELDLASASAVIRNLPGTLKEVEIDTASGACSLENLTVEELEIDSASGPVSFVGSVERLEFEGASAPFTAKIENCPQKLNLETLSANLDLTLPEDCGHTVEFKGASGKLSTEFDTRSEGNSRIFGDGACKIKIETKSGWVNIHKQ